MIFPNGEASVPVLFVDDVFLHLLEMMPYM